MPYGKLETLQDCEDFAQGCLFMGTGGGGDLDSGMSMLRDALADGITLEWVDVDDIPDDVWSVTPFGMGSIAPTSQETLDEIKKAGPCRQIWRSLYGRSCERTGGISGPDNWLLWYPPSWAGVIRQGRWSAVPGWVSPWVDGDYAGRAIPDEMQGTPFLYGKQSWPASSVDNWGNVSIVKSAVNPYMFERVGKMMAVNAFGSTTMAATPLPAHEMKEILVRGTLTKSLALGRALRQAREKGEDPIDAALAATGGWRLFEGIVTKKEWEDRDGYMFGTTHLDGTKDLRRTNPVGLVQKRKIT